MIPRLLQPDESRPALRQQGLGKLHGGRDGRGQFGVASALIGLALMCCPGNLMLGGESLPLPVDAASGGPGTSKPPLEQAVGSIGTGAGVPRLWYRQPAEKWTEALPIGNGRLGAMVFGGVASERIQFNEDTLWKGRPHDYVRAGAGKYLAEIRRLLAEGKNEAAEVLAREKFLSDPVRQQAYQPFGDLRLQFAGQDEVAEYRRELDLDSGVARVTYRLNEVAYRREMFASYPDQVIVIRLTADRPGRLSLRLSMDSPHTDARTTAVGPDTLVMSGQVEAGGLRFESRARVIMAAGRLTSQGDSLTLENADAITIVMAAGTSFRNFRDISAEPGIRCVRELARACKQDFGALLSAHLADHRRLFRRVNLDLGGADRASLPTDERLKKVRTLGLGTDPALLALYFHYGRYLLIASSRPGTQPANLQGIWNDLVNPPWESKWTLNINCEMNYWPAELANLSECHEPLFDLIDDLVISGRRTAKAQYGCNGWVVHHNTDLWRGTAPINNIDGVWPTGGAWLCHHLWERFLFTGDKQFLARRAYPVMKQASRFFMDYLVADATTGWLVTSPSYSPEQGRLTAGPTMDQQLIRALMTYTIQAAGILGIDQEFAGRLATIRNRLAPNQIGRHGQLQEWQEDVDEPNNAHRHMSPLWALYPGTELATAEPRLLAAAKMLLTWRGDGSTGWSYAWRVPLWARVGDGDFAHRQLSGLLQRKTLPNLFDLCGPFQIDGNFGATAGMVEMLLQSHELEIREGPGFIPTICLLPALPTAWPAGSVRGLCARGGFEVDLVWEAGRLTRAVIRSKLGQPCRVRYAGRVVELATERGRQYKFDGQLRRAIQDGAAHSRGSARTAWRPGRPDSLDAV